MKNFDNIKTASFWAKYLLWNLHDLDANIKEIE